MQYFRLFCDIQPVVCCSWIDWLVGTCINTTNWDVIFCVSVSKNYLNSQWTHLHTHTNVFAYTHAHTRTHTHTHTHTRDCLCIYTECCSSGGRLPWRLIQVRKMRAGHLLFPPPLVSPLISEWTPKQLHWPAGNREKENQDHDVFCGAGCELSLSWSREADKRINYDEFWW